MNYRNHHEFVRRMNHSSAYEFIEKGYSTNFKLNEWLNPEELKYVDYRVIYNLDDLRDDHGRAIIPSQHPRGLIRTDGSEESRHFVDIDAGKLGKAVDVFPRGDARHCWLKATENPNWGGIGVYLDTIRNRNQPGPMMHLDIDFRNGQRSFWVRVNKKYIYLNSDPDNFWKYLAQASE